MHMSCCAVPSFVILALASALSADLAYADQLVYVPLAEPCRLLDTRASSGTGMPLTATNGPYLLGTDTTSISSAAQHGSSSGCGIPVGIEAVSVSMNMLNTTVSGNIATWNADSGTTAPNIGTGVYNSQVTYNTGYSIIPVGATNAGKFYLQVANGQIDMTINIVGYWLPLSWSETRGTNSLALGYKTTSTGNVSIALGVFANATGNNSTALGTETTASGIYSTTTGYYTVASGPHSTAMGSGTTASGAESTAMGNNTTASGNYSTAMGSGTMASGISSTAIGSTAAADGNYSVAMGTNVGNHGYHNSFIWGDGSVATYNYADNQFVVRASGGFSFYTSGSMAGTGGAQLAPGSSSWTAISDRNAKDNIESIDARDVLQRVAAIPLSTWHYKTQDKKYRHMGPMAQDFYAAFHLGETDKGIDTIDADGVALAAIQGLNTKLDEKDAGTAALIEEKEREITALRTDKDAQIAVLQSELDAQKAATLALKNDFASMREQFATIRRSDISMKVAMALQP